MKLLSHHEIMSYVGSCVCQLQRILNRLLDYCGRDYFFLCMYKSPDITYTACFAVGEIPNSIPTRYEQKEKENE